MHIVIPTLGRPDRQITFDNMPPKWQARTTLVVQHHERDVYDPYPRIVLPEYVKDIATTRHILIHEYPFQDDFIVMLDDDLVFSKRRVDEQTKFRGMIADDWDNMFYDIEKKLRAYAHVGVSHREGANRNTDDYVYCSRQMRVLGFDRRVLREHGLGYGRIPVMEDFDMTLRLLRLGYPNCLLNLYVHNQAGSDQSGGCSTFRTPEMQNAAAEKLAALHPNFVKVRTVPPKGGWKYERKDVTVYWKKAFESAQHERA